jgi:HEPN domain-containing protein
VEILQGVLRRDTAERSATEVLRDVLTEEESIETLLARLDRVEGHVISQVGPDEEYRRNWLDDHPDADRLRRNLQRRLDQMLFEPAIDLRTIDLPDLRRQPATPEPPSPEPDIGLSW